MAWLGPRVTGAELPVLHPLAVSPPLPPLACPAAGPLSHRITYHNTILSIPTTPRYYLYNLHWRDIIHHTAHYGELQGILPSL